MLVTTEVGGATFQSDCKGPKEAAMFIGSVHSVFQPQVCGCCGNEHTHVNYRKQGGYDFLEHKCDKCGATLKIGENKEGGTLFLARSEHRETYGWSKYERQEAATAGAGSGGGDYQGF